MYYSNRSAAYCSLKRYRDALLDAQRVVALKPRWIKGHARVGAAHFGLEEYEDAAEAYRGALRLERDDRGMQAALQKAEMFAARQAAEGKHTFKTGSQRGSAAPRPQGPAAAAAAAAKPRAKVQVKAPAVKDRTLLSFGGDEEEEVQE